MTSYDFSVNLRLQGKEDHGLGSCSRYSCFLAFARADSMVTKYTWKETAVRDMEADSVLEGVVWVSNLGAMQRSSPGIRRGFDE